MFAFGKNKQLFAKLEEFLKIADSTMLVFDESIKYMLENGIDDHFVTLAKKTHRLESNADDVRRQIEQDLYEKSLLPETRKDLLEIVEALDRIPNRADKIVNIFVTQKTEPTGVIKQELLELLAISMETFTYTCEATNDCFGKVTRIQELNQLVDNNESIGDELEQSMITQIFEMESDTGEKLLQKELVIQFGAICDLCESVMDRIVICSIKRVV